MLSESRNEVVCPPRNVPGAVSRGVAAIARDSQKESVRAMVIQLVAESPGEVCRDQGC